MRIGTTLHGRLIKASRGGLGGGTEDGDVLVLTHTGAKSGKTRITPLMFLNHDHGFTVCASKGGAPEHPAWFHNLRANPNATVTVGASDVAVRAEVLEGAERDGEFERFKKLAHQFAEYERRTTRRIPVVLLRTR